MNICVVGLGKIGLPLAVQFASKGHDVVGADINASVVDVVSRGREPFPGEADLAARLKSAIDAGLLVATTETTAAVKQSEVVVVAVPLLVDADGRPEFDQMDAATESIGRGLRPGTLVSYETTLPVGSTRGRITPALAAASGLLAGKGFYVVFSPERVLTGRVFADLRRYPKLVGGIDSESERRGVAFYGAVLDFDERSGLPRPNGVWAMGSAESAEMAKLAETTYRDVNIGLANQFARFADEQGIDIRSVIEACNSQPYSHIHTPGIAVGGHCIPVYPKLYLSNDPDATIVRAARQANEAMPAYAVARLAEAYGDLQGATVAVLGASYRGGVKETAMSGVFPIVEELESAGAHVTVHDPLFSDEELHGYGWTPFRFGDHVDAAIIQADHPQYQHLSAGDLPGLSVLLDGRGIADESALRHGVSLLRIGNGRSVAGLG